jgi:hypothetical protein
LCHLHSGGGEKTINAQIQTFKALCGFASFNSQGSGVQGGNGQVIASSSSVSTPSAFNNGCGANNGPTIHIDLHIHLPENKSSRDYKYIIEDIARFIYRHETSADEQ